MANFASMKRILFYYDNYCGEYSRGGTEVATARIASAVKKYGGWEVFNGCKQRRDTTPDSTYKSVVILKGINFIPDLAEFIKKNEIDVVVNMGRFYRHKKLEKAINQSGREVKLLFMHHFAPGNESKKHTYKAGWHLLRLEPENVVYWIRATFYPIFKLQRRLCIKPMYRKILRKSDGVILLSEGYRNEYLKTAFGKKWNPGLAAKFTAIPNIYETSGPVSEFRKEKRVLILSRMDEIQKRITLALKIWKIIETKPELADWRLDVVGTGDDNSAIVKYAKRSGLQRVTFHGWKESKPFLQKSAILMSTSDYEGLSLAMIEAQYYGTVPIAFDSYASLRDIVEDGETGVIVSPSDDANLFAEKLSELMLNDESRKRMSEKGVSNVAKFSAQVVGTKWLEMLSKLS